MPNRKTIDCFIENLAYYSYEKKLTINQMAELLGVSQSTISMWRTGKAFPRIDVLEKLAEYFGITVSELLSDNSNSNDEPTTIAAHFDGDEYTEAELDKIKEFAEFVKSQRKITKPTSIPKNTTSSTTVNAAHADDYANAPDDLKKLEEDIMDDDDI